MPTSIRWKFPVNMTAEEKAVAKALKRIGKFYVFLREIRAELFDEEFQAELAKAYQPRGTEPKAAALLAMVTLLQAYDRTGDAEAVITAAMDKRWQLVLNCLGAKKAPFSQGLLPQFRERMIEHGLDKKLLERTVELAKRTGKFGWRHLKVALDSSPLLGAGRVLDTWNLIGRALSTVVTCAAKVTGRTREEVLAEADITVLSQSSLKVALDIDWDDDEQRAAALDRLLQEVDRLEKWVATHAAAQAAEPPLREALVALRRVLAQDLEPDPTTGQRRIQRGVARDRMPSLGDPQMRHGRKSKNHPFNGYKRHFVKVLEPDIIAATEVLPANQPEQDAFGPLVDEVERHGPVEECFLDRGYLGSPRVSQLRSKGVIIRCKPWPSRNRGRFAKDVFDIRLAERRVICPAGESAKISSASNVARFPDAICAQCKLRSGCTVAVHRGRTVTIHPQESLLIELRQATRTSEGRSQLRHRVTIEHSLARITQIQGVRARYKGTRKNSLDARRSAAIANLQVIQRMREAA
jgi:hypothetical protein